MTISRYQLFWMILALCLLSLFGMGCGFAAPTPQPTPTWTMSPQEITATELAYQLTAATPTATATPTSTPTATLTPTATSTPTPTPTATLADDLVSQGIQYTLDIYNLAYNTNDTELLNYTIDQDNKPFKRLLVSRYEEFQTSFLDNHIEFQYTLESILRREDGFVEAHIIEQESGWAADWLFRQVNGQWVLSEPTVQQIGKEQITTRGNFIFHTYPWIEDVNREIEAMMLDGRDQVKEILGRTPDKKVDIKILPIYGLTPFDSMSAVAIYKPAIQPSANDVIQIYAPHSYVFGEYDPEVGWKEILRRTLIHEYTHMAHTRSFDDAGYGADWMSEGLAEYVAGEVDDLSKACYALSARRIPIVDTTSTYDPQDLMNLRALHEDVGLAYSYSYALVAYIVEEQGGMDQFWALAEAYDDLGDMGKAVWKVFQLGLKEFDRNWRNWLRDQC